METSKAKPSSSIKTYKQSEINAMHYIQLGKFANKFKLLPYYMLRNMCRNYCNCCGMLHILCLFYGFSLNFCVIVPNHKRIIICLLYLYLCVIYIVFELMLCSAFYILILYFSLIINWHCWYDITKRCITFLY